MSGEGEREGEGREREIAEKCRIGERGAGNRKTHEWRGREEGREMEACVLDGACRKETRYKSPESRFKLRNLLVRHGNDRGKL
jgi:hypothetical protein